MRPSLSLKTLIRTPVRTILTFLLIAVASFTLFSRVTDYTLTSREMANAESYFSGVASLDNTESFTIVTETLESGGSSSVLMRDENRPWPTDEQIEAFSSLPGVTFSDTRYMTAGLAEDFKRMPGQESDRVLDNHFAIEGTYTGYTETEGDIHISLFFDDVKLLAGEIMHNLKSPVIIKTLTLQDDMLLYSGSYPIEFFRELNEGSRCLILGYDAWQGNLYLSYGDQNFSVVDALAENYLETEEYAYQRDFIEAIKQNAYVHDIVYTADMRSIPHVNERILVITEGRPLITGDTDVCVVSTDFLNTHNLAIGDKIKVGFGDRLFPQNDIYGARDPFSGIFSEFINSAELTIIGAYRIFGTVSRYISEYDWYYTYNTIFVPASHLPIEIPPDHEINRGEFSVFIENARDIDAFLAAAGPLLEEMDVTMRFSDGGWMNLKENFETGSLTALLTTVLYLCGAALALLLAVYLYIARSKKAYAIMRAMGVTTKKTRATVTLPLSVLSASALLAGGIAGLVYAANKAAEAFKGMVSRTNSGYVTDMSLPLDIIILCLLGELIFIIIATLFFLRKMERTSPLELLQGDVIRVVNIETKAVGTESGPAPTGVKTRSSQGDVNDCDADENSNMKSAPAATHIPQRKRYPAYRHVIRYILRHMRRVKVKTAISLSLALVLTTGIGFLVLTRLSYQDAFHAIDVKGRAWEFSNSSVNLLSARTVLTDNFYYYGDFHILINGTNTGNSLIFTDDISRYLYERYDDDYTVLYAEGFDASLTAAGDATLCLIGSEIAGRYGIGPGDSITFLSSSLYSALYRLNEDEEALAREVGQRSIEYQVAGVIHSDNEAIASAVFAPANKAAEAVNGVPFKIEYFEFIVKNNERIDELISLLDAEIERNKVYAPSASYYLDTEGFDNIKLVRDLLVLLFPVAVTAAVLIGLTAPGLIIMQSAKEAAILRVLGTTKKRVRCMLMFEQIILCAAGLLLTAGGLVLYNLGLFTRSMETLAICGALYLLGCICAGLAASISVTRRRVLVLLQVKE